MSYAVGWIAPTMMRRDEGVFIIDPPDLVGREVVSIVGRPCGKRYERDICGLNEGHYGAHWQCSPELVQQSGPYAMKRVLP